MLDQREQELLKEIARLRRQLDRVDTKEYSGGTAGGGSVTDFTDLTDTPSAYTGSANAFLRVGAGTASIVFGTVDWTDIYNKPTTFAPTTHGSTHWAAGTDPVGTATPTADAIPYADGSGLLDAWISAAGTATRGRAAFTAADFSVSGGTVSIGTAVPRFSDLSTVGTTGSYNDLSDVPITFAPSSHASSHQNGGSDEIATATPGANAIVKADGDGKIGAGWIDDADINLDNVTEGTTNKFFTATEETKLANIEALADVTDAGNVGAAIDGATVSASMSTTDKIAAVISSTLRYFTYQTIRDAIKTYYDSVVATLTNKSIDASANTLTNIDTSAISNDAVSNPKLANMAESTVKGRAVGAGTGDPTDLSVAQLNAIIDSASLWVRLTGDETVAGIKQFSDAMGIGTSGVNSEAKVQIDHSTTDTGAHRSLYVNFTSTPSGNSSNRQRATFLQANMVGGANLTNSTMGLVGLDMQAVQLGSGTVTAMSSFMGLTRKNGAGPVTSAYGAYVQIRNENASGAITDGIGYFVDDPVTTGAITNSYGFYVKPAIKNYLAGSLGIGTDDPQGALHAHDGTGGMMFVTKTGIVGSAVTLIPGGTGDVVRGVNMNGRFYNTAGQSSSINTGVGNGSSNAISIDAGANQITFAVSAGGALTAQRTAGTATWSIALTLTWL